MPPTELPTSLPPLCQWRTCFFAPVTRQAAAPFRALRRPAGARRSVAVIPLSLASSFKLTPSLSSSPSSLVRFPPPFFALAS
eukprot:272945-Pleurochrysis_carterae.AAC.1